MSLGQKIIVTVGAFVITFITVCMIFKNDIRFLLTSRKIERQYGQTAENSYFIEDHFGFLDNHVASEINSRQEIINSIYYLINSGISFSKRYCAKNYDDCYNDVDKISEDTNLLSILNNYVHPYNSFDEIMFYFNEDILEIDIKHIYSKGEIAVLNSRVDDIIKENIDENMSTREKIKVIHDYIINNATYDIEFDPELEDDDDESTNNLHRADTAYGVLVEGYGICSGYSDAMMLFLNKLNIVNYKISNDQHIWNLVLLDGEWVHLDLTWDDPVSDKNITRDNYFLISSSTLEALDDGVHYYDKKIFLELK